MNTVRKIVKTYLSNEERKARVLQFLENGSCTHRTLKDFIDTVNMGTENIYGHTYASMYQLRKEGKIDWEIETEISCKIQKGPILQLVSSEPTTNEHYFVKTKDLSLNSVLKFIITMTDDEKETVKLFLDK